MPHLGTLREYRFSSDTDDIRGSKVHGPDNQVLGQIDDVLFDHSIGQIQYAVIDTGGWLSSKKFIVPAYRISEYKRDRDEFYVDLTKEQVQRFPEYNQRLHDDPEQWKDYESRYREHWSTEGGVLHREDSPNTITPYPDELPAADGDVTGDFTPERLSSTFSETAPNPNKIRMRPAGTAARAEDTRIPGTAQTSERWRSFEDNLRRNRVDITASCRACGPAKDRAA